MASDAIDEMTLLVRSLDCYNRALLWCVWRPRSENRATKHMLPPILLCLNFVSEQVPCTCRISWILRILMGQSILFAQASSQLYIAWIYVQCSCCCLLKLELYLRSTMRRPSQTNLQCIGENVYVHTMYTFEIGGKRKPWRRHVGEFIEK